MMSRKRAARKKPESGIMRSEVQELVDNAVKSLTPEKENSQQPIKSATSSAIREAVSRRMTRLSLYRGDDAINFEIANSQASTPLRPKETSTPRESKTGMQKSGRNEAGQVSNLSVTASKRRNRTSPDESISDKKLNDVEQGTDIVSVTDGGKGGGRAELENGTTDCCQVSSIAATAKKRRRAKSSHTVTVQKPVTVLDDGNENDDDDVFEVEKILDMRVGKSGVEYLLKWAGYPDSDNSWVPVWKMDCPDLQREFHLRLQQSDNC